MKIKNLEVKEILATKLDSKTNKVQLKISFTSESPLTIEMPLEDNFEAFIDKVIKFVKANKKEADNDNDDNILGGISIVNIANDEDIKEKAPRRLFMLEQKILNFKKIKTSNDYMRAYSQLNNSQEIIYQK